MFYKLLRLALLLLVVYSLFITITHSQISSSFGDSPAFCCNSQPSARVVPGSVNLQDIVNDSPFYGQVSTPTIYSESLDSICSTFFKFDDNSFLKFNGFRYADGSYIIQKLIVSPLTGYTGVNRVQGLVQNIGSSSFVYDQVYLGSACPGVNVYYTYFIAGRCDILNNATQSQADYVNGDSSSRDISEYCKGQVAVVANSQQLRGTQLVGLPNQLNRCCVTQFNRASCVNADRVLPQDSVSVPDAGTSSQTCTYV